MTDESTDGTTHANTLKTGFAREVGAASTRLLGRAPRQIYAPGGSVRETVRVEFDDRSVIMTRRRETGRSRLEADCLARLGAAGAPVPRLLGYDGTWLAQEYIPGRRLSVALAEAADEAERCELAEDAIGSLFEIAEAAERAELVKIAPALGAERGWVARVVARPGRLARRLQVPLPQDWDPEPCIERLHVPCTTFVKWDARSANAIVAPDGRVAWIDWEHAGRRLGVEDFAWLAADEYFTGEVDDAASAVARGLVERTEGDVEDRLDYLAVFAALHATVRLELIWNRLIEDGWQDPEQVLHRDSVGASRPHATCLVRNGAAWARRSPMTAPLAGWFGAVGEKLDAWPDPAEAPG